MGCQLQARDNEKCLENITQFFIKELVLSLCYILSRQFCEPLLHRNRQSGNAAGKFLNTNPYLIHYSDF